MSRPRYDFTAPRAPGAPAPLAADWKNTTPQPQHPALTPNDLPIGGSATDRVLAALGGLALTALIVRAFAPF